MRFVADISDVLAKADALRHSFADEDSLDVRQYISQKVQFYREAGETSEDSIVRRVHRDLNPELSRDVRLHACGNTITRFQADVITQAPSSRRAWTQTRSYFKTQAQPWATRPLLGAINNIPRDHGRYLHLSTPEYEAARLRHQIPYNAARQVTTAHPLTATHVTPAGPRADAATSTRYPDTGIRVPRRTPYPCTHCQSTDHIDPQCPQNPRQLRTATQAAPPVPAY